MVAAKTLLSIIALISTPTGVVSRLGDLQDDKMSFAAMTLTWDGQNLPSVATVFDGQGEPIAAKDKDFEGGPILKGPQFGRYSCSCSGFLCIGPRRICKPLCEEECGGGDDELPGGGDGEPGEDEPDTEIP